MLQNDAALTPSAVTYSVTIATLCITAHLEGIGIPLKGVHFMDLISWSQLLTALSKLPVAVLLLMTVLVFILCVYVLASKKACDNCVRVIAAIRGDNTPKV